MRLKRLVFDLFVACEQRVFELLFRFSKIVLIFAQQRQLLINRSYLINLTKTKELPVAFVGRGRIKDVVKPALCFRKPLVLAEMNGDSEWKMKEQFPIVVRIRAAAAYIDLLVMKDDLDQLILVRVGLVVTSRQSARRGNLGIA